MLSPSLRSYLSEAESESLTFIVPDPYWVRVLRGQFPEKRFQDIFTWAAEKTKSFKPDPLELLDAVEYVQQHMGFHFEGSLAERWSFAHRFARDWEEVLLGTLSVEEALRYWDNLSQHRAIQRLFGLQGEGEALEWLAYLPLPRQSRTVLEAFWGNLTSFVRTYQAFLQEKNKFFAEASLQKLLGETKVWEDVVFIHLYSTYPLMERVIAHALSCGARAWSWNVTSLQETLAEIWEGFPSGEEGPLGSTKRPVSLIECPTLVEVVEKAAQDIATYLIKHPSAVIAVWCEREVEPLLRHFWEKEASLCEVVAPPVPTLWEATEVGATLQKFLVAGLAGRCTQWPEAPQGSTSAADRWAERLYRRIQEGASPADPEAWRFLFELFQAEVPEAPVIPASVRAYVGRLSQLAGGAYDALFVIAPSVEPLGSWSRPTLWLTSLRRQFFPREKHYQLLWRLQSILLWGSKEVLLYRQSGEAYQTPLEEFIRYGKVLGLESFFQEPASLAHRGEARVTFSPFSPDTPLPAITKWSPTQVAQFFICPRRFYWRQLLTDLPLSEPAQMGILMHELVESRFRNRKQSTSPARLSLRRLAYRFSPRRLKRQMCFLLRRGSSSKALADLTKDKSLRVLWPFVVEVGQPVLRVLAHLSLPADRGEVLSKASFPLRWHHFRSFAKPIITCWVESTITSSLPTRHLIHGRVDLLVQVEQEVSEQAGPSPMYLIDFKQAVPSRPAFPERLLFSMTQSLAELQASLFSPPKDYQEVVFQLLTYLWMLHRERYPVEAGYIVSLWWRPAQKKKSYSDSGQEKSKPFVTYSASDVSTEFEVLENLWTMICTHPSMGKGSEAFPQTSDKRSCTYCDFALLCDRLEVV